MKELAKIKNSYLLQDLSDDELSLLAPLLKSKSIEEGSTIFVEQMPGEFLYLIQEGTVKISRMIAEGEEKTLILLGPEDVFGELAVLDGAPRSANARAAEKALVLGLSKADFEGLCDKHPKLGMKLMRNIILVFSRRVRSNQEEFRQMLLATAAQK